MFCFKHDASHISKLMEKGDFTMVYEELLKFDPNVMNNSEVLPNVMKFYILKSKDLLLFKYILSKSMVIMAEVVKASVLILRCLGSNPYRNFLPVVNFIF